MDKKELIGLIGALENSLKDLQTLLIRHGYFIDYFIDYKLSKCLSKCIQLCSVNEFMRRYDDADDNKDISESDYVEEYYNRIFEDLTVIPDEKESYEMLERQIADEMYFEYTKPSSKIWGRFWEFDFSIIELLKLLDETIKK